MPVPQSHSHTLTHPLSLSVTMSPSLSLSPLSTFSLLILLLIPCIAAAHTPGTPTNLVRSSCRHASYPSLCIRTLSTYPGPPAQTLAGLAQAAVKLSLVRAQKASEYLARLARNGPQPKPKRRRREKVAIKDCAEQLSDAAAELRDTVGELERLRTASYGDWRWRMSNAKTWVSAALTCQSTCLDGISEAGVEKMVINRDDLRKRIRSLSKLTSNALYLINLLDQKKGKGKSS